MSRDAVTLIKKDKIKRDVLDDFRFIVLLNSEVKMFTKVFANRLVPLVKDLVGDMQICAIPTKFMLTK